MKMIKFYIKTILFCLFSIASTAKAFAYGEYDIAVENADGVTIHYKYTKTPAELAVAGCDYNYYETINIVIPEYVTYDGCTYSVTSINPYAFSGCRGLTSVTIPNSVTSIGYYAFEMCSGLTSVTIPNCVTSIGSYAFKNCSGLISMVIPNSVKFIGDFTFAECSGLTSVSIGNSVREIGNMAFASCISLTSVVIPNSVASIGFGAFYSCCSMTETIIEDGVNVLYISNKDFADSPETFTDCPIEKLYLGRNLMHSSSSPFRDKTTIKEVIIGDNVTSICSNAFEGCTGLTSIEISNSVTSIGDCAFDGCNNLETIVSFIQKIFDMNSNTFSRAAYLNCTLYVPEGMARKYKVAEGWKEFYWIEEGIPSTPNSTYTLTYEVDGEVYKTYEVEYGATITAENTPSKEGYTFSGWSEVPATMPAHDVTVTGSFTVNTYTLTYEVDGEVYKTYKIEYGATIEAENAPSKEGYTFSGWSEIPDTMPAHDVTVTGSFTVIVGIKDIESDEENTQIYTLDGKRVNALHRGVNIIRHSDGTVTKIFVK